MKEARDPGPLSPPTATALAATGPTVPTLFHVTHWKAGSQWIFDILRDLVPQRIVEPKLGERQFFIDDLVPGAVYPTLYVTREQLLWRRPPEGHRTFVVLRDLRDTLVSAYFSARYSHQALTESLWQLRGTLNKLSKERGLLLLAESWLPVCAAIQASWLSSGHRILWYEDLLSNDVEILEDALLGECALGVPREALRRAIETHRFVDASRGRQRGEEISTVQQRKGVAGDWRNHFTARITAQFEALYGPLLRQSDAARGTAPARAPAPARAALAEAQILAAYDELAVLYPNVPSYLLWMSWECAAYRACPIGGHVLDYGCADGRLAKLILGGAQRITGMALNDAIADAARHYGPYDRIMLPGEFESDDGTRYDAIFARGTLALVQDLPRVLQTLRARLRSGGVLVCSVHTDLHETEGGLTQVLGHAGFRLAAWRQKRAYDKVHGLRRTPALPQWRAAFEGAGFRIEREFDIVPQTAYFFFTLIDGLWHQKRGRGSTLGHRISALLAARSGSVEAMRSFLSGLIRLADDNSGHAAAVFVVSAPP